MRAHKVVSGVDYLTLTCPRNAPIASRVSVARAATRAAELQGEGKEKARARWYGYDGWQQGRIFFGEREDGFMVRATSAVANDLAFLLPSADLSISRIDVQVTVWYEEPAMMLAKEMHAAACVSRETRQAARRMKIRLEDGSGDGDTLYLGSRSSAVFGRIYDKHKESSNASYTNAWRWELQVKDELADRLYTEVRSSDLPAAEITRTVGGWFAYRGAGIPGLSDVQDDCTLDEHRPPSDDERSLMWLDRQVKPVLKRLVKHGRFSDILKALDLAELVTIRDQLR